jgi:drug/metabolite transporter (DMT)-like permease
MPHVLLLLLSTLWGASYTFIRVGVETIPPITFMAGRTSLAAVLLLLYLRAASVPLPRDVSVWKQFGVQALLNSVVPFTLLAWAEREVQAGIATILNSTAPVLAFAGTALLTRHEPVSKLKLLGVVAGLVGTCLAIGPSALEGGGGRLVPQLAIVCATVCYAAAAIYGRSFNGLHPALPAAGSLAVGAIALVPASLVVDRPWSLHPSRESLFALGALAVFSTALAMVIYFRLVRTIGSVGTTAQAYLRVPVGVFIGVLFLNESLPSTAWWGMACVVGGVLAMSWPVTFRTRRLP